MLRESHAPEIFAGNSFLSLLNEMKNRSPLEMKSSLYEGEENVNLTQKRIFSDEVDKKQLLKPAPDGSLYQFR